jgi:hypothetical protein
MLNTNVYYRLFRRAGPRDASPARGGSNALPQPSIAVASVGSRPVQSSGSMNKWRGPTRYSNWAVMGTVLQGAYPGK